LAETERRTESGTRLSAEAECLPKVGGIGWNRNQKWIVLNPQRFLTND